jgi:hypothetical protein
MGSRKRLSMTNFLAAVSQQKMFFERSNVTKMLPATNSTFGIPFDKTLVTGKNLHL